MIITQCHTFNANTRDKIYFSLSFSSSFLLSNASGWLPNGDDQYRYYESIKTSGLSSAWNPPPPFFSISFSSPHPILRMMEMSDSLCDVKTPPSAKTTSIISCNTIKQSAARHKKVEKTTQSFSTGTDTGTHLSNPSRADFIPSKHPHRLTAISLIPTKLKS